MGRQLLGPHDTLPCVLISIAFIQQGGDIANHKGVGTGGGGGGGGRGAGPPHYFQKHV